MGTIHRLAGKGDPFELLALLEAGADPNDPTGKDGESPLMAAASESNHVAARLLLKWGAAINYVSPTGRTALLQAKSVKLMRFLIERGADPDAARIGEMTQMAFVASFGNREVVDLLIEFGADTSEKMNDGRTVQDALDDPTYRWDPFNRGPKKKGDAAILKLSGNLSISPEQFVAEHPNIFLFGYHNDPFEDPALAAWANRVFETLRSEDLLEAAYLRYLDGTALQEALKSLERLRRRSARDAARKRRQDEFEAIYFKESDASSGESSPTSDKPESSK